MEITLIVIISILIGLGLFLALGSYFYLRARSRIKQLDIQLLQTEIELKKLQEVEKQAREENYALQIQVNQTNEDPVTNLLGWQLFEDRLNLNIKESERYQFTMGVMFIDIDEFKVINDALSYEVGDALLKEVGMRLDSCIRQVDSITRFTKDTFVVLLGQLAKAETAAVVAQRMLQSLAVPFHIEGNDLFITASIGIAIYPADGQNAPGLLRSADHALHLAKAKGKGVYQFYQEKMHTNSQRELTLHTSLNRESVFQEFQLYYQPIVNVKDESVFCMDTLLRWQHPQLGLISPQDLFAYAEKQRKLKIISEWILKSACKQFLHWRSLGFSPECIAISLSMKQLDSSHFIYRISQILQELNFMPEWLLIEIKESSAKMPLETLEKAFNMLKYVGVRIAIDDFGAESIALSYLKNLSINYIKIHASMIEDIDSNSQTFALIKSIIYLANNLSIQVMVQGVESEKQAALLKELGCTLMQGHLLGDPLTEREVADKMVST